MRADRDEGADRRQEDKDSQMGRFEFYGQRPPGRRAGELKGKLVVVEGPDGVGRSTHIGLLQAVARKQRPRRAGYRHDAVGACRQGPQGGEGGPHAGRITMSLFYATDFADRLENEMIPALRAGFVVLTDRYIYSLMARAIVRGADPQWIERRLRVRAEARHRSSICAPPLTSWSRAWCRPPASTTGNPEWTCGSARTCTTASWQYQGRLLTVFDRMSDEYGFRGGGHIGRHPERL